MWMFLVISLGILHIPHCSNINSRDQYDSDGSGKRDLNKYENIDKSVEELLDKLSEEAFDKEKDPSESLDKESSKTNDPYDKRRYWLVSSQPEETNHDVPETNDNESDDHLKNKIITLVEQQLHDVEEKAHTLHKGKEKHKDEPPYKIGFILSLVKRSKITLAELFNTAIKHRNDYKALQEMKIFELIVHSSVDTTNLVRQMAEIHIKHINSTTSMDFKQRVALL